MTGEKSSSTAERLNQIMTERGLKQVDVLELVKPYCQRLGVKFPKNYLSQYLAGTVNPKQDKLTVLGLALNVSEVWLMGYDVPRERNVKPVAEQSDGRVQELLKLFDLLGEKTEGRVFRGSRNYISDISGPVESDAAKDLIRRAMSSEYFAPVLVGVQ